MENLDLEKMFHQRILVRVPGPFEGPGAGSVPEEGDHLPVKLSSPCRRAAAGQPRNSW
ncbi:Uncharacterised protein [Acinetobacter baumannii]|nr:Uncharacterised protein [Acinetobacter baumannii]